MADKLNDHHRTTLHEYMRFARYLRGRRLKAVDGCFADVRDSRLALQGETYNRDEVLDLLDELQSVVRGDVESELINVAHSNAVLLQSVFEQAEKWHLKLNADTTNLENRDLLEAIKHFEEDESRVTTAPGPNSPTKPRLEPLNDAGASALLQREIDRLQEDNARLRDRLKMFETKTSSLLSEKATLSEELDKVKLELASAAMSTKDRSNDTEVSHLREQLATATVALDGVNESSAKQRDLEDNLVELKHELLRIREELESSEKELNKKVSEATAYVNLKKMLHQKNDLIKMLRVKLAKYEPDATETQE